MKRWWQSFAFAIAVAVVLGFVLSHLHFGLLPILAKAVIVAVVALGISWYAFKLYHRPKPFEQTRRFARAMYYNGLISMEELQRFCDTHPEDEDGNGTDDN